MQRPAPAPVLLCGIPGSGKSTFARWLQAHKAFECLDVEEPGELEQFGLESIWNKLSTEPSSIRQLQEHLQTSNHGVVIIWGFPPQYLPLIAALKAAGIEIWWFDGDHTAARQSFLERGDVPIEDLELQMAHIEKQWPSILEVFAGRIIEAVRPGPSYADHEEIYRRMFGGR